jgi:hypothetical protein
LVKRGNVTLWFAEEVIVEQWKPAATGKRGAVGQYSDMAIQTLLTLKAVFSLKYRSVEGFGRSLMQMMGVDLRIPDHSTLSRRAKTLNVEIPCRSHAAPLHIVIDSTGVKSVWRGRMESTPTWRK